MIPLAVDGGSCCTFPEATNSSKSSTRKRRSPRTPTRKQRKYPLLVQRRNEVSLTCRNSAASAIVRNLCFSSIEMYLPIQTWSYLVLSIHLLPPKVNPSSRDFPPEFLNFFIASTSAGAALVGLLFVAVSIAPGTSGATSRRRQRLYRPD